MSRIRLPTYRRVFGSSWGTHQGIRPGPGAEPADSRPYQVGDDFRSIDWITTARLAEPHVRPTLAERELHALVVVDGSASMSFGTRNTTKLEAGLAALGLLITDTSDQIAAVTTVWASGRGRTIHGPRPPTTAAALIRRLADSQPTGALDLADTIQASLRLLRRRGLVVIVSDFIETGDLRNTVQRIQQRHELIAITCTDPAETAPALEGVAYVTDPETGRQRVVDVRNPQIQTDIARLVAQRDRNRRRTFLAGGASYIEIPTEVGVGQQQRSPIARGLAGG